jgi:glycosyltransferase involved in cell wall biosynthesis
MNIKPKISVIMAAYNAEKYIAESIESILSQTFKDFELIIINDASTDKTLDIIQQFAQKDSRVIFSSNSMNLYATKSRNLGLKIARGDYIAIQDADDISFLDRLDMQYEYLEKNKNIYLVGSGAIEINGVGREIGIFKPIHKSKLIKKKLSKENCIYHSTVMFRNIREYYRDKIYYSEDYDFYLNILSLNKNISNIKSPLIYYRILSDSVSRSKALQQVLFAEKAKKFYQQRLSLGKDEYDTFDPNEIFDVNLDKSTERIVLLFKMKQDFYANNFKEARKKCLFFFKNYGFFNKALIYYGLSFFWTIFFKEVIKK